MKLIHWKLSAAILVFTFLQYQVAEADQSIKKVRQSSKALDLSRTPTANSEASYTIRKN